jgi:hypothetical protein
MTSKTRMWLVAPILSAVLLLIPGIAGAQRAAIAARASAPAFRAQPVAARSPFARIGAGSRTLSGMRTGVRFNPATNSFVAADGSPVSLQDLLNPSPGFGADYRRLSPIGQNPGAKAVLDPVTEWNRAIAGRSPRHSPRFAGPGFYLLVGGGAYGLPDDSASADQGAQSPSPSQQNDQQPDQQYSDQQYSDQQPAEQPAPEDQAPLPDVGQFTLVLQNGDEIQAIGFTRVKDRIVYITVDGLRRTLAAADLDSGATVRINEERGTPLQLPL